MKGYKERGITMKKAIKCLVLNFKIKSWFRIAVSIAILALVIILIEALFGNVGWIRY